MVRRWRGVCATTSQLRPVRYQSSVVPDALVSGSDGGVELAVDGTIGGDTTVAVVESYTVPAVGIGELSPTSLSVSIDGNRHEFEPGTRTHLQLPARHVRPVESGPRTITPELHVRFPDERELHHPALGAECRLFPSFGLDLGRIPDPVAVPTANGELNHEALAERLGVDLAARPYPERVLWQAFAYTVFDPILMERPAWRSSRPVIS